MAIKDDIEGAVNHLVGVINDTIAVPMERHFTEMKDYMEVKEDVHTLKIEMRQLKKVLDIS